MAVVGQLLVELSANVARLRTDMERASGVVEQHTRKMSAAVDLVAGAFGAIGAGLSAGALVTAFRQTADQMDALNDAADRTGASVEQLSAMLNTLRPYGATIEQITEATGKLARSMAGADDETRGAGAAFAALGVSTRDAAGNLRPTVEVMHDIAQALSQFEDGTNKTVLAQTIFGKTGAALLPMLKDLAGAKRADATVSTEMAAAAEQFNVNLGVMLRNLDALKVQLAGPMLTALSGVIERFNAAGNSAENFYNRLRLALQPDSEIARLTGNVTKLEAQLRGLESVKVLPEFETDRLAEIATVTKRLAQARKELSDASPVQALRQRDTASLRAQEDRGFNPMAPRQAPAIPGAAAAAGAGRAAAAAAAQQARAFEDYAARIQSATAKLVSDSDLVRAREFGDTLEALDDLFFRGGLAADVYESAVAKLTRATSVTGAEGQKRYEEEMRRTTEALRDAVDPTRALYRELDKLDELLKASPDMLDVVNARRAQIMSQVDGILGARLPGQVEVASDAVRQLGITFQSAFEDAIVGGERFSRVLQALGQDILRIAVRKSITEPLVNALFGGGSGANATPGLLSGFLSTLFGGAREKGGPVWPGAAFLVGERGKELFVPDRPGTIVPNHALAGGTTVVHHHYHIDSRADRSVIVADIQRAQRASIAMQRDARLRGNEAFA